MMAKSRMAAANHHGFRPRDKGTSSILASYPYARGAPGTGVVNANRGHAAQARETHRKASAATPNPH